MLVALAVMVVPLVLFIFMKSGQEVTIIPKDSLGKSSIVLNIVFLLFFIPIALLVHSESDSEAASGLNPALAAALTVIPAAACVTGTISMVKSKERCLLVFFSTTLGVVLLLGAVGYWFI